MKTILTLLLAILWLPVTSHCLLLESASSLAFLSCCAHEDTAAAHEDECASDACATVEDAQYTSTLRNITVPPLDQQVAFALPLPLNSALISRAITPQPPDDALARLPVAWQFSFRTALPPRAPSLVS